MKIIHDLNLFQIDRFGAEEK